MASIPSAWLCDCKLEIVLDQAQTPLLTALLQCGRRPHAGFYLPGHQRGRGCPSPLLQGLGAQAVQFDLPELPELDDLFAPSGAIAAAQALAAAAFGADQTWFLTNGSTCGVMAALLATCGPADRVIVPRNAHLSVINGLVLSGAEPVFVTPHYDPAFDLYDCLTPAAVDQALTHYPDAKAVLIVSPTYEGICGDLAALAAVVHRRGLPLLVDEAHGTHFKWHAHLPTPALAQGADLVVQSTHKTGGAITQAAMLHRQGTRIDSQRVERALRILQSTSPNYLLLASLDAARHQMVQQGHAMLEQLWQITQAARTTLQALPRLPLLSSAVARPPGFIAVDTTRITIGLAPLPHTGFELDERLQTEFGVIAELPTLGHLTFVPSLGTRPTDMDQLVEALTQITLTAPGVPLSANETLPPWPTATISVPELSPRAAYFAPHLAVPWHQAVDQISADLICPYPPGIPILVPGERITGAMLAYLRQVHQSGGHITGCADPHRLWLRVVQQ